MRRLLLLLMLASASSAEVVLDRMAVIVGKHVIKTSDIDWDLRVTQFLNREPLNFSPKAKRQSAERLIDQEIIRQEIVTGNYRRPPDSDAAALLEQSEARPLWRIRRQDTRRIATLRHHRRSVARPVAVATYGLAFYRPALSSRGNRKRRKTFTLTTLSIWPSFAASLRITTVLKHWNRRFEAYSRESASTKTSINGWRKRAKAFGSSTGRKH